MFIGPDYSVIHPGIFPHNVEAAELATIREWLAFDVEAGWGTDEYELSKPEDATFPERWKAIDDRYDARDILDDNLALLEDAHRGTPQGAAGRLSSRRVDCCAPTRAGRRVLGRGAERHHRPRRAHGLRRRAPRLRARDGDRRRWRNGLRLRRPRSQRRRARQPLALRPQRRAAARQVPAVAAVEVPHPHGARRRARAGAGAQLLARSAALPAALDLVDHPHGASAGRAQAQAEHPARRQPRRTLRDRAGALTGHGP